MPTAGLQTVSHRRRQARLIAAQTFLDAAFHFRVGAMHFCVPFTTVQNYSYRAELDAKPLRNQAAAF
jgi:hypothetical protein